MFSMKAHPIILLAPINTTGSAWASDVINLENYAGATIIVSQGAWAGGSSTLTVEYCDDATPTTDTAMAFNYRTAVTGAGATDQFGALTACAATGLALSVANTTTIIELAAAEIEAAGAGSTRFIVKGTTPGANADYIAVSAILWPGRYLSDNPITAID